MACGLGGAGAAAARAQATGLEFLDPAAYQNIPLAAASFSGTLPERAMVAPLPRAGQQGTQGSCVGWAVAYLKAIQEAIERKRPAIPADGLFSPAYIYNQIRLNKTSCKGASYYVDALNLLSAQGNATWSAFPYQPDDCSTMPSPSVRAGAFFYRINSWRRVNTFDDTEVKTHLANNTPILIGMPVDGTFKDLAGASVYQGLSGSLLGGHAMLAVGYDDDVGGIRLLNSWGEGWGDGGFAWISYKAFRNTVREGYVVEDRLSTPGSGTDAEPYLELETVLREEVALGVRSVERTTEDHHCESNCAGEPTRTNYRVELATSADSFLRNLELRCVAGPCHGWNSVLSTRLEQGDKVAVGSWDVWTRPTTWRLSAEEVRRVETGSFVRRIRLGEPFVVVAPTGSPAPLLKGRFSTGGEFVLTAGKATPGAGVRIAGIEVNGPETLYKYETVAPP